MNELLTPPDPATAELVDEAEAFKQAWAQCATPEARAALEQNPSLAHHKSFFLDLVYGDFCTRREAGEVIDPDDFLDKFPAHRSSLRHRLRIDKVMVEKWQHRISQGGDVIWPESGEPLGEYTLVRELGRGTFARVYLATEASTGDRPVVLKVSRIENAEARTLGRLAHENIVPVFSARRHEESQLSVVCMPYLGSATLHDVLDRAYRGVDAPPPRHARPILDAVRAAALPSDPELDLGTPPAHLQKGTWVEAISRIGERLASALAFVHRRGILHRDLKPSNILLDAAGRPLLLDFNLSDDERVDGSLVGGTMPYMSPEQLRLFLEPNGEHPKPDGRADLFALGVILYELLTGHHPFGRVTLKLPYKVQAERMLERQQAGCTPLRCFNPNVDRRLAALIESCLAFDAKDRPANAALFADKLKRRFAPANRLRMTACLAGVLVLTMGGGLLASHNQPAETPVAVAVEAAPLTAEEEYQNGVTAFEANDFRRADACFERALDKNPDDMRFLVARGRSQIALGHPDTAFGKYMDALKQNAHTSPGQLAVGAVGHFIDERMKRRNDAQILAGRAYALLLAGQCKSSAGNWDMAEKAGFPVSIDFTTNRDWARLKSSWLQNDATKYQILQTEMDQVVKQKPDYLPARWVRMHLAMDHYNSQGGWTNNQVMMPGEALEDVRTLDQDPELHQSAELHFWAIQVCGALATSPQDAVVGEGLDHLRQAVLLGWDKPNLLGPRGEKDPILPFILRLGQKDYDAIVNSLDPLPGAKSVSFPQARLMPDPGLKWLAD